MSWHRVAFGFVFGWLIVLTAADLEDQSRLNVAVEALTRMEDVNLDQKPAVKAAVNRVLEKTRGSAQFVRLVQHFKMTNQTEGLLQVAIRNPQEESGVTAIRLILASAPSALRSAFQSTNAAEVVPLLAAAGNANEKQIVPWIIPLVSEERKPDEIRRSAVRALTRTRDGATALLDLAKTDKLPDDLKFITASELHSTRWPEINAEAARLLPLPAGQNSQPLPPISELVKMKGDANSGSAIFRRETTACIKCHQVRGEGRELGPALSEIGSKLPKEALYESILDPSAGISFGFEAWQVQLKSGDEAYGLKASETADEVAIKDINGIVTRYKRSEIQSMQQTKTSIMPTGLQMTMSTQEIVDLIEYLASLKKPSSP